ncbi:hypothetical protein LIER_14552 [Lithospermum erythrorhizon]|uniref:Uncharacterized protein n=1 Tax=Lithospermum erythrorhizon TaxID=34254 RepID=A0AAV3Q4U3_LITER
MAHPMERGRVSKAGGTVRCLLFLVIFMLICYVVKPPSSLRGGSNAEILAACSPCVCDCSTEADFILTMPFDGFNETFADCGKNDPEMSEEMEKDFVALLSEEVTLQKNVTLDSLEHTRVLLLAAKRVSLKYQNEAEKCNAGVETCEEARERAEATLREERKLTAVWEARARDNGWSEY